MNSMKRFKITFSVLILFAILVPNANSTEECFEKTSRAIFKFNMALDDIVLEPLAKGYNKLPTPLKTGTNNLPQILQICFQYQIIFYREI